MKKSLIVLIVSCIIMQAPAFSQHTQRMPPSWVSDKGWWVVESNIHSPKQHIVYFYNNDGVLVYKEKLEGIRLKPQKEATKMQLKEVLEALVLAWEKQHVLKENESLVVNRLRKK
jgi:hypothetical protein